MRLLFVFFFFVFSFPAHAQKTEDACVDSDIQKQVTNIVSGVQSTKQSALVKKHVEIAVEKGFVRAERKNDVYEAAVEFFVRRSAKCDMPDDLAARVSRGVSLGKPGGDVCRPEQFAKAVDRQHKTLKDSGGYDLYKGVLREGIAAYLVEDLHHAFIQKWDADVVFRESVIRAGLEIGAMQVSGCSNPEEPALRVIESF